MMKQKNSALSNTKIAIVFFIFLTFIVGISLIFKVITLIRASQYDSSKRFTLSVGNGKSINILSLSPSAKNIAVFKLADNLNRAEAGRQLAIPVDGFIVSDSLDLSQKAGSLLYKAIFIYNNLKTNLTIIDLLRLAMAAGPMPESAVNTKNITKDLTAADVDKIVGRSATDEFIEKDNQTIRVVNATGVSGLGNRLARLITNMGGDVIIVATGESPKEKSSISYIDEKTYTVERLQRVLGYDTVRETDNAISDITITIGEDKLSSNPF